MTKQEAIDAQAERPTGLALLRLPFPEHQISKLPKPTTKQTKALKDAMDRKDFSLGIRCKLCGQWHHKDAIHLDYVGHAAITDRLLEADPAWNWEPTAFDQSGAPMRDQFGGMWIKLTVCGVTRLGYGHPDGKSGGDAVKEVIGDALRNAAMRFGAALDLWHKGDLHGDDASESGDDHSHGPPREAIETAAASLDNADNLESLKAIWMGLPRDVQGNTTVILAKDQAKARLEVRPKPAADLGDDSIPY